MDFENENCDYQWKIPSLPPETINNSAVTQTNCVDFVLQSGTFISSQEVRQICNRHGPKTARARADKDCPTFIQSGLCSRRSVVSVYWGL